MDSRGETGYAFVRDGENIETRRILRVSTNLMLIIGLVGGVASGKSLVAEIFHSLGCEVIDADRIGHEALKTADIVAAVGNRWPVVIDVEGRINRSVLAEIVFRSNDASKNLGFLESLLHPIIEDEVNRKLSELSDAGVAAVVLDAPVLLESGWHQKCNKIVFVDAPLELRIERATTRGWQPDELTRREEHQLDIVLKKKHATDIIINTADKTLLEQQVRQLLESWGITFR